MGAGLARERGHPVRAGLARERERSSRRDSRGLANPAGKLRLPFAGKARSLYVRSRDLGKVWPGYRGGRSLLEAAQSDFVCRAAPRLIAHSEGYPEARFAGLRIDKVGSGNQCEVGEPVIIVPN